MPDHKPFAAFLFDMDGTLLNSVIAAERVWAKWAQKHGLDVDSFLPTIHGVRSIDTVRKQNIEGIDVQQEAEAISQAEIEDVDGVAAIEGVAEFLASLPANRWAVVTSAPLALAKARMKAAGLALPDVVITAEDVTKGKPAPDGFLLAAQRLGVEPGQCLVFEDAPAGIAAGKAAGASVVVITAAHLHPCEAQDWTLPNYLGLKVRVENGQLTLAS
ncbi:HAD-IA family hydrolase [Pseudomonas alliivorans]|nr:HAD-IA family hydrolase [Pseudomonas alliivorans]MEE4902640.1 HAD-IA family hydrolase [Pseudomonas alliivorans]MEE5085314.1 HAD-IA family hydrolase [Pseudomonas alliivorans]MEE5103229.1 HAD-IA family hydrolase [Pseudomonas alliivorans]MEE5116698.1 HAD-IA family hydrolase [Pseudomonas alliivorans]